MNVRALTEADVRALRDRVFERQSSDANWRYCKEHWLKPEGVRFLQEHDFPLPDRAP